MRKVRFSTAIIAIALAISALMAACSWKPEVSAVPLTDPWTRMNLPVKQDAVVWKSDPTEFRAVHRADKRTVTKSYTDSLRSQGWTLVDFSDGGTEFTAEMDRDGEHIALRFYDFDNTGVVIERK